MVSLILASLSLLLKSSSTVDGERLSRATTSDRMFFWLVVSSIVVGVGVVLEAPGEIHEFKRWLKLWRLNKTKSWFVPLAFLGLIVVTAGIVGEGIFEYLSSDAETAVRKFDESVINGAIGDADRARLAADAAVKDAAAAKGDAGDAKTKADTAKGEADVAVARASSAKEVADEAEASSIKANTGAADAQSKIADAERELKAIRTPRSLTDMPDIIAGLQKYKGTEYALNVFPNEEAIGLTKQLIYVLDQAGWIRKHDAFTSNLTSIGIFGTNDPRDILPSCIDSGVVVHIRAGVGKPLSSEAFMAKAFASKALMMSLRSRVSPPNSSNVFLASSEDIGANESPIVVCVGQKP